jgi:hypothetical protein
MTEAAFIAEQDFLALRLNQPNHALMSGFAQDTSFQLGAAYNERSPTTSLHFYLELGVRRAAEEISKNRQPAVSFEKRPRFKQHTFSGKPLSDEETIHATAVVGRLEDDLRLRRLLGR